MQLYYQLREDIINGVYNYNEKLPSKRILAEEAGTSVITVEHTYAILCDEGYIDSRERKGYFVTYKSEDFTPFPKAEQTISGFHNEEYIHNEDEFPFSVFAKTMRNVISEYGEQILVKSPNKGCIELRNAIRKYLSVAKGMSVSTEQIIIGSGAEYFYGLIVQLLGREKIFAIENPSYEKILSVYHANGVFCERLKLGNDGIMTSELNQSKASVLHITPFKSFPSGITASVSKRLEYIRWAKRCDGIIIEDDFDSEFTISSKHEDTVFSLDAEGHVIYINTFSKTIAPSMRMGYMILPENLLELFEEKTGFYSCTVPVFEQYVIAEFINNGDFQRHINRVRRKRRQGLKNK